MLLTGRDSDSVHRNWMNDWIFFSYDLSKFSDDFTPFFFDFERP